MKVVKEAGLAGVRGSWSGFAYSFVPGICSSAFACCGASSSVVWRKSREESRAVSSSNSTSMAKGETVVGDVYLKSGSD